MKEAFVVNAEVRADQGKGASRRLRRAGKVPAVIYGGKSEPQALALSHHEMARHLETEAFYSHILTLKINDQDQAVVLKDVQRHPSKPVLLHFDFQRVLADQAIRMHVPLHFKGAEISPGVKTNGGVVEHYLIQVEVECLPKHLPEFIEVDMSTLDVNDTVRLSQLKLPPDVTLVELRHENDALVAAVHVPKAAVEEAPVAEVPAGEVPATAIKTPEGAAGAAPATGAKAAPGSAPAAAAKSGDAKSETQKDKKDEKKK
ncbi:MAG: 50S ribosomal protein L25/general stress protein Ctc [Nevskiales bacterium]|nr:50S ribosomal protein L25/general stress protein Ctc [Nevskiales bacterium]